MKLVKKSIVLLLIGTLSLSIMGCSKEEKVGEEVKETKTPVSETESKSDTDSETEKTQDKIQQDSNKTQKPKETTDSKKENSPETVIAIVNDIEIKQKHLTQQLVYIESLMTWQYGENYKDSPEAMAYYDEQKRIMVDYLVDTQVMISKAPSLGIEILDTRVEEELELLKAGYNTEEEFEEALKLSEMSLEDLKQMLKDDLTIAAVVQPFTQDIVVEEEEAKQYYEDNIALYTVPAGATMSHILVEDEETAKKVKEKYDEGTSFEELASKYGTDATKSQGGLLEYIPYNSTSYDKDFLNGAKSLKEGEVSSPVKTQFGWHLIKVEGVSPKDSVTPFEEVKVEITSQLIMEKENDIVGEKVEEWRKQSDIVINENLI